MVYVTLYSTMTKHLSGLNRTLIAGQYLDSVGEQEGKQQGSPGPEYLGSNIEAEAISEAARALSGDANLLRRPGKREHKRTEDFCGKL